MSAQLWKGKNNIANFEQGAAAMAEMSLSDEESTATNLTMLRKPCPNCFNFWLLSQQAA